MRHKGIICTLLATLLASGCTQPVKEYSYVNLNRFTGWKDDTQITLEFEMADTTNACQLYIVGEIAMKRSLPQENGYPVLITLIAPDSTRYRDSVTLPLHVVAQDGVSRTSHGVKEIEWPYRKNIYNKKPGQWKMILSKAGKDEDYSNIIGLGAYCKQEKYEFKR